METQEIDKVGRARARASGRKRRHSPRNRGRAAGTGCRSAGRDCHSRSGAPPPRTAGRSRAERSRSVGLPAMSGAMLAFPNMRSTSPPSPLDEAGCTGRGGSKDAGRVGGDPAPRAPELRSITDLLVAAPTCWNVRMHAGAATRPPACAAVKPSRRPVKPGKADQFYLFKALRQNPLSRALTL